MTLPRFLEMLHTYREAKLGDPSVVHVMSEKDEAEKVEIFPQSTQRSAKPYIVVYFLA